MKLIKTLITFLLILGFILFTSIGLWFFQGGNLNDLIHGCFIIGGCTK